MKDSKNDVKWIWVAFGKIDSDLKTWKNEGTWNHVKVLKNGMETWLYEQYRPKVVGKSIDYFHPFSPFFKKEGRDIIIQKEMKKLANSNVH